MSDNDDGGVAAMEVDETTTTTTTTTTTRTVKQQERHDQLPWVEKYRPDRYVLCCVAFYIFVFLAPNDAVQNSNFFLMAIFLFLCL